MENIHDNLILTLAVVIPLGVLIVSPALFITIKWYCWPGVETETLPLHEVQRVIQNSSILSEDTLFDMLHLYLNLNPIKQIFILCLLILFFKTSKFRYK